MRRSLTFIAMSIVGECSVGDIGICGGRGLKAKLGIIITQMHLKKVNGIIDLIF